jgi:hypothetical protein
LSLRTARVGAFLFFLLFAGAVTWPGMLLGNRIEPRILGLPFPMVWVAGWVLAGGVVLFLLDRVEERAREAAPDSIRPRVPDGERS